MTQATLNAMHAAESTLQTRNERARYLGWLAAVTGARDYDKADSEHLFRLLSATADQRAEAFLKSKGLWDVSETRNKLKTMENPFGITREEVLELAAKRLVDAYGGDRYLSESAERMISDQVKQLFASGLKQRIDSFLDAEMKKIVGEEIVPVNIWGEREGKPTTIRAELAKRAQNFWNVCVDKDGRESSYGGSERSKVLMEQIVKDAFSDAIKSNSEVIVAEFKAALKTDATKLVTQHIDKLITVRTR